MFSKYLGSRPIAFKKEHTEKSVSVDCGERHSTTRSLVVVVDLFSSWYSSSIVSSSTSTSVSDSSGRPIPSAVGRGGKGGSAGGSN